MPARRIGLAALALVALLLLPGCHLLGLVKSTAKPKAGSASVASSSTASGNSGGAEFSKTTVAVQNGGGVKGRGAAMVSRLKTLGFRSGPATNAKVSNRTSTVIYFKPGYESDAARIQTSLGLGTPTPATAADALPTDILVVVGRDF